MHSARGGGGGDRGGRGGEGRGGRGRGRGGAARTNEQGDTVFDAEKKQGGRFQGKPRGEHAFDKQSGAGRGTRKPDEKKGGHGRGNWGAKPDRAYKRGQVDEGVPEGKVPEKMSEATTPAEKPAAAKVEEEKEPETVEEEVILGVGLDDFLKTRTVKEKVDARKPEGIKGAKVQKGDDFKLERQGTLLKKDTAKVSRAGGHELLGFTG